MPLDPKKAVIALSGGVDSSVAAALLSREYDVVAVHFTKFDLPALADEVRAKDQTSLRRAQAAAELLKIPLRVIEAGERFKKLADFFCAQYDKGQTPNPCVVCNATIKWPVLMEAADDEGAFFVATGHYARLEKRRGLLRLFKSQDPRKDQTYFLHRLSQEQLGRTLFPLSEMSKPEAQRLAAEMRLPTAAGRESQEICFVPSSGYRRVIESHGKHPLKPGNILDSHGRGLGTHEGYQLYTIGQRKGLGVALGRPAYVVAIDPATGNVTLGPDQQLLSRRIEIRDVNWISPPPPAAPFDALVKIRYNHAGAAAIVSPDGGSAMVEFPGGVRAATPGQAAVFYCGDEVIGGGWIAK